MAFKLRQLEFFLKQLFFVTIKNDIFFFNLLLKTNLFADHKFKLHSF